MPFIRSSILKCYILLTVSISFNKEIISPYSYYTKKGLVYVTIISPSNRQPSFYLECTKANIYSLYNIRSVFFNKYISFCCYTRLNTYYNRLVP